MWRQKHLTQPAARSNEPGHADGQVIAPSLASVCGNDHEDVIDQRRSNRSPGRRPSLQRRRPSAREREQEGPREEISAAREGRWPGSGSTRSGL